MAVASLRIPEAQIRHFQRLISASAEDIGRLPELLSGGAPAWSAPDFERRLAAEVDLDPQLVKAATVIGSSLLATAESGSFSAAELPEAVAQGVSEHVDLAPDSDARARLVAFLRAILSSPGNFGVSRKVQQVGLEYEHPYLDARILTDVRPVFGLDDLEIATSVIVHSLRISTEEGSQDRSHYFAMDRDDLVQLRELIDRALKKESVIRERLKAAGMTFVRAGKVDE